MSRVFQLIIDFLTYYLLVLKDYYHVNQYVNWFYIMLIYSNWAKLWYSTLDFLLKILTFVQFNNPNKRR